MIKNYQTHIKESVQPDEPSPFNLRGFNPLVQTIGETLKDNMGQ